jgi:hypothetical protein
MGSKCEVSHIGGIYSKYTSVRHGARMPRTKKNGARGRRGRKKTAPEGAVLGLQEAR